MGTRQDVGAPVKAGDLATPALLADAAASALFALKLSEWAMACTTTLLSAHGSSAAVSSTYA